MNKLTAFFASASKLAEEKERPKAKRITTPFSIRLTPEERAWLDEQAGYRPLGDYIRAKVLCDMAEKRRALRKPSIDSQELAVVLAMLGESRLSSNLNQLAKHANTGTLDISDNIEAELHEAHHAILEMRDALMVVLGKKRPKERPA